MTHVHSIIQLDRTKLTNQQLADMALSEDQQARAARRARRWTAAAEHQLRADALAELLK